MSASYNLGSDDDHELHVRGLNRDAERGAAVNDEAHVIPAFDAIDHTADHDCVCYPRCETVQRDNGSLGWLYIHHSLDGRERREW